MITLKDACINRCSLYSRYAHCDCRTVYD